MTITETIQEAFAQGELNYYVHFEGMGFGLVHRGKDGVYFLHIIPDDDGQVFLIHSHYEMVIPIEFRSEVAEFIVRVNYLLRIGFFCFDQDEGIVTFRYAVDMEDGELAPSMVTRGIMLVISTLDLYRDALNAVIFQNMTAEAALMKFNGDHLSENLPETPSAPQSDINGMSKPNDHD